jgi:hypothetical protein
MGMLHKPTQMVMDNNRPTLDDVIPDALISPDSPSRKLPISPRGWWPRIFWENGLYIQELVGKGITLTFKDAEALGYATIKVEDLK